MSKPLYRTTVTIWTDEDPSRWDFSQLAQEAQEGCGYPLDFDTEEIARPTDHPEWNKDMAHFFEIEEEDA